MLLIETRERYFEIVETFNRKGCFVNDYLRYQVDRLISRKELYELCGKNNAFLLVKKNIGFRVYYYLNDFEEQIGLPLDDYVVELLFREDFGEPIREIEYLERCGFEKAQLRCQMTGVYSEMKPPKPAVGCQVGWAQDLTEVEEAVALFNSTFDPLTGCYVSASDYQMIFANRQIIIARDFDGRFLGAAHVARNGRVTELLHLAVVLASRGQGIGRALCDAVVALNKIDEKSRYGLFTQVDNVQALTMYQTKGYNTNGRFVRSMVVRGTKNGKIT